MIMRRLLVNSDSDVPNPLADLVTCLARRGGLETSQAYRLRLAADEITTNIACHGYRGRVGLVELSGGVTDDKVWLRIVDDAPPFDPHVHRPDLRRPADPTARVIGGLGLHLAFASVDEIVYDRHQGRNRNLLVVRRPSPDLARLATGGHDDHVHGDSCR